MEVEIDESCNQIIARLQPAAGDLRMVMTVSDDYGSRTYRDEAKKLRAWQTAGAEEHLIRHVYGDQACRRPRSGHAT